MALFSIFGKKPGQPDSTVAGNTAPDAGQDSLASPTEESTSRESPNQRSRRDIARITAEKIDAIESEIARDILKSPRIGASAEEETPDKPGSEEDNSPEYAPPNLFHTTLIRVDKETKILFKEDMDE